MDEHEKEGRINALRQLLDNSQKDIVLAMEGMLPSQAYEELKANRQAWITELKLLTDEENLDEHRTPDLMAAASEQTMRNVTIYEAGDAQEETRIVRSWPLSPPMRINPTVASLDIKAVENLTDISVTASSNHLTFKAYTKVSGRWMVSADVSLDAVP